MNWDVLGLNGNVLEMKCRRQKTPTAILVYTGNKRQQTDRYYKGTTSTKECLEEPQG